jgi:hypothetical protein
MEQELLSSSQQTFSTFVNLILNDIVDHKDEIDSLFYANFGTELIIDKVNEINYEKFIQTQIRPFAIETIEMSLEEMVEMTTMRLDTDKLWETKYEYDSLDEPIRPKADRWTSRVCPLNTVEKIEISEFDPSETMYKTESIGSFRSHKTVKSNKSSNLKLTLKKTGISFKPTKEENDKLDSNTILAEEVPKPIPLTGKKDS